MPIILYTSKSIASAAIAHKLIQMKPATMPIDTGTETVLDVPVDFDTDCIIVLSPHKSREGKPMLTAHFPGNWGKAEMGGKDRTLNIAHGSMLKRIIWEIETQNRKLGLDWPVLIEADHHGPLAKVPMIYVEIGSSEKEWGNPLAAQVVAEAVNNAVSKPETRNPTPETSGKTQNPRPETATKTQNTKPETIFGVGGGHYAREFTKLVLERDDLAVGHICPKYAIDSLDEDTFRQAIEKSVDPVKRVLVLKEGTNAKQKEKVKNLCRNSGVDYEETGARTGKQ